MSAFRAAISVVTILVSCVATAQVSAIDSVKICGSSSPLLLFQNETEDGSGETPGGVYVENFQRVSEATGVKFEFVVLPWRRCLNAVSTYNGGTGPDVAIGGTYSETRAESFYFVGPIFSLQSALFYSRKKFKNKPYSQRFGAEVTKIEHMQEFSVCGIQGWNYAPYYTEHSFPKSAKLFLTNGRYEQLFPLLSRGRCDLFETPPIYVLAELSLGKFSMPNDVVCNRLASEKIDWNLLVSKNSPRAEELIAALNDSLDSLQIIEDLSSKISERLEASKERELIKSCL